MANYSVPPTIDKDFVGSMGRYYERTIQGKVFCFGGVSTALVAANATATGLSATAQPIIGVYNPPGAGGHLTILKCMVAITSAATTSTSPGSFVWVTAASSTISTGSTPILRLGTANTNNPIVQTFPSRALGFAFGTALTGLSGNLTNTLIPLNASTLVSPEPGTATALMGTSVVEELNGSWIVQPGGFLGIMGTTSTTTVSCHAYILWEE